MAELFIVLTCLLLGHAIYQHFRIANLLQDLNAKAGALDTYKAVNRDLKKQMEANNVCHGTCIYRTMREHGISCGD